MSDFFSRLIDRSTGSATVARPVIAPLFDPVPALDAGADAWRAQQSAPSAENRPVVPHRERVPPVAVPVDRRPTTLVPAEPMPARSLAQTSDQRVAEDADALESRRAPAAGPAAVTFPVPFAPPSERSRLRVNTVRPLEAAAPMARRGAESTGRDSVEGAPVVVVRIGRIEVKATTPAAPPKPQAPRKPNAVSLEEYLQPRRRDR